MELKLIQKINEATEVVSFIFEPASPLVWQAGQYLRYKLADPRPDDRGESRFFSIASAPYEKVVRVTCRFSPEHSSRFKEDLKKLELGETIEAAGPLGRFVVEDPSRSYVFIAGGIGITPFRSILLDLDHRNLPLNVVLLYSNRSQEVVFRSELEELALRRPSFRVYYFIDPNRFSAETLKSSLPDLVNRDHFYISGPEPMVKAFEVSLPSVGVAKEKIKHDYFPGYAEI